jgi:hypothetical protein
MGMAAFRAERGRVRLVRNHEIDPEAVEEDGIAPETASSTATSSR